MKFSLSTCLLTITICQLTIAGDTPKSDDTAQMEQTFEACMQTIRDLNAPLFPQLRGLGFSPSYFAREFRHLKECEANYTVDATTYTKQPLISAISHLKDLDQGYSPNDTRVYGLLIRCQKGKFPFRSEIVKADQPLLFTHAMNIMEAVQKREVSSEIDN